MTRLPGSTLLASIALLCCLLMPQAVLASEEIARFHAEVRVLPDGSLDVTETIGYRLGAGLTKRGIFRDFPMTSPTASGGRAPVTFEVLSVTRNGRAEPYTLLRENGYTRVRIGLPDVFLPAPSQQTYELRYRTEGQLRGFRDFDELYWNVTGHRWAFPIEQASVTITLPAGADILQHAAYTGRIGAQEQDYEVTEAAPSLYRARTTAPLLPGRGFTVAVAWPKGLVAMPAPRTLFGLPYDRLSLMAGTLAGVLALLACWFAVGRDPKGGAIYPQFTPPKGIGPAAARYVQERGFDNSCLTAAIVSMAVKGALRIVDEPSDGLFKSHDFSLEPLGSRDKGLTPAERAAYTQMFPAGGVLILKRDSTNGKRMDEARRALKGRLKDEHYGASFLRNWIYTLAGIATGVVVTLLLLLFAWQDPHLALNQLGIWLLLAAGTALPAYGLAMLPSFWRNLRSGGTALLIKAAVFVGFTFVAMQSAQSAIWQLLRDTGGEIDLLFLGSAAVFGILAVTFHFLMAAPTKSGRRLLDHIEGFALYLGTAEEERLNLLNPPERTPALFEKLLPYAIALGLDHEWSAKFAGVLSNTGAPNWYRGHGRRFNAGAFGGSLGSAISATSMPSKGGSGSGGGGFSGGGGGGSGGGSW